MIHHQYSPITEDQILSEPPTMPPFSPNSPQPNQYDSEEWMARGFKAKNKPEKVSCFRKAAEINPTSIQAWNQIAWNTSDPQEKEHCYRKVIELDPTAAQAWMNLGNTLINPMDRIRCYQKALNRDITLLAGWVNLAFLLEDRDLQETIFRKIYELNPANYGALKGLSLVITDPVEQKEFAAKFQKQKTYMKKSGIKFFD